MNRSLLCAALALSALVAFTSPANANLIMDIRVAGTTATSINVEVGQTINFEVWANVTALAGTQVEGLQSLFGSLLKQNVSGNFHGSFVTYTSSVTSNVVGTPVAPFDQFSEYGGGQALYDLNGDGDLDVGGTSTVGSNVAAYIQLRDPNPTKADGWGPAKVLTFAYTIDTSDINSVANIFFKPRSLATTAVWFENNVSQNPGTSNPSTKFLTGQVITMTVVPEPATLALLGVGGLLVLKRRNRKV
jgi:hypothetical protein